MEEEGMVERKEDEAVKGDEEYAEEAVQGRDPSADAELYGYKEKYIRLYAEFDNYRKRVLKEREELIRYGNESLLTDLLPVLDSLDMALRHSGDAADYEGIVRGVEMTLREFRRVLEKSGLTGIEAAGKPFDPSLHHAMAVVERQDMEEMTVAEELRKGYLYADKVLRPSMVTVSKKNTQQ